VTPAFYTPNLKSPALRRLEDVAELSGRPGHQEFDNKIEFIKWCASEDTEHTFYTLVEPRSNGIRIAADNPAQWMHGFVADYDGLGITDEQIAKLHFSAGMAPAYVTRSFSGGARLIWVFAEKVPVFTTDVYRLFIKQLTKVLRVDKWLPGYDEKSEQLHQVFELGHSWSSPFGDTRVPANLLNEMIMQASNKAKWPNDTPDAIPLEKVEAEVNRRWPGKWIGPFVEGARGPRFWDSSADHPTGAVIRPNGVQAFTGEGRFLSWREILGEDFVKQYRTDRVGGAITGTWFAGREWWMQDDFGTWRSYSSDACARRLNTMYGLSRERKKGQQAEVDAALTTIENTRSLDGAFPFLYRKEDVVVDGGERFLNISRIRPVQPLEKVVNWGEGFPWIANYLTQLFDEQQLKVFLSWLHRFYRGALEGRPKKGQALFVAGPHSAGKTFLSFRVIGGLAGGFAEATDYVLGTTTFNGPMFFHPVWTIDDAVASADPRRHATYSQIVKKIVANPTQQFHAKYKDAVTQRWDGRLVVTLNDDPESIAMLPNIENTILDKITMLLARATTVDFRNGEAEVTKELPAFAAYVRDFVIPEELQLRHAETARFGHDSWHHPELLATARQSSSSAGLAEFLEMWRVDYFRRHAEAAAWEGNATELMVELSSTEGLTLLVNKICPTVGVLTRNLHKLVNQGFPWVTADRTQERRFFRITNPGKPRPKL
jgi:hypothetical protein